LREANLSNLTILNLSFNEIKDIDYLKNIKTPYLKELYLNNNNIEKINVLEHINFKNLEILNLEKNKIEDINIFYRVKFKENIKELNLGQNPIKYYSLLNLCYFQSLEKIIFHSNDLEFQILSIKLKLFGYELEKGESINNLECFLFIPFELYNSSSQNIDGLNYKNSFKIITNRDINFPKLKRYFIEKLLEMNYQLVEKGKLINFYEKDSNTNFHNHKIIRYNVNDKVIYSEKKVNNFILIKEYRNLHKISFKYNRLPNYLEEIDNNDFLNLKCQIKERNSNYYNSLSDQIIDNNQIFSKFLKKHYYYNSFPIIFINFNYYNEFLNYLYKCPKYKDFKFMVNLNIKLILPSNNNYKYKHLIDNNDITLIGDVVENIDLYDIDIIIDIINKIKHSMEGDYKQNINEWVMTVMDILVEFFLFILNKKPCYYICPFCNNSILYIYNNQDINNNTIINETNRSLNRNSIIQFNELSYKTDFDNSFYKSILICSNLNNILFDNNNFKKNSIIDFKKRYQKLNAPKNYFPANPPKKNQKCINIIYHDENHKNFQTSINKDARRFEEASNGTFIFSNSIDIFQTIMKEINSKNNNKIKFLLITTGSTFKSVISFLNSNNYSKLITKACIYCMMKDKYIGLIKDYPLLEGVYNIPSDVVSFIQKYISEDNEIFDFCKLVTYEKYISKYYELHKIISKYYSNTSHKPINNAIQILKEILNKSNDEEKLIKVLEVFENEDYQAITKYTEKLSFYINSWLLNLDNLAYEKSGYFIGGLMYKLNEYGIKRKKGVYQKSIFYRGLYINYLDALSYQIYKGKIISFQTFLSTTERKETANFFAKIETPLNERQEKSMFSTIIEINYNWEKDLFPLCFDISDISYFTNEKEFLFHPYTFFKINDFSIDLSKNILELKIETIGKKEILEEQIKIGKKIILNEASNILETKN